MSQISQILETCSTALLLDATEQTQVDKAQLEAGTVARVNFAAAHSQFFFEEIFFESSTCLTPFLQAGVEATEVDEAHS